MGTLSQGIRGTLILVSQTFSYAFSGHSAICEHQVEVELESRTGEVPDIADMLATTLRTPSSLRHRLRMAHPGHGIRHRWVANRGIIP